MPQLEHHQGPELSAVIAELALMVLPHPPDVVGADVAAAPRDARQEQLLAQVAEVRAQPLPERDLEALLASMDELGRQLRLEVALDRKSTRLNSSHRCI